MKKIILPCLFYLLFVYQLVAQKEFNNTYYPVWEYQKSVDSSIYHPFNYRIKYLQNFTFNNCDTCPNPPCFFYSDFPFKKFLSWYTDPIDTAGFDYFNSTISTIADKNGKMLLLTDGFDVYNQNFQKMKDSIIFKPFDVNYYDTTIFLRNNILIKKPGFDNLYYLFSLGIISKTSDLSYFTYSIIDLSLDSGKGNVTTEKKINLLDNITLGFNNSGLAAVRHRNGKDFWIITNDNSTYGKLYAILLTSKGIDTIIKSNSVPNITSNIRFNPQGNKMIFYTEYNSSILLNLLDFDNSTGLFSNKKLLIPKFYDSLKNISNLYFKEIIPEFSSDGKNIWVMFELSTNTDSLFIPLTLTNSSIICSFNICDNNTDTLFNNTKVFSAIDSSIIFPLNNRALGGALFFNLASDGRIYSNYKSSFYYSNYFTDLKEDSLYYLSNPNDPDSDIIQQKINSNIDKHNYLSYEKNSFFFLNDYIRNFYHIYNTYNYCEGDPTDSAIYLPYGAILKKIKFSEVNLDTGANTGYVFNDINGTQVLSRQEYELNQMPIFYWQKNFTVNTLAPPYFQFCIEYELNNATVLDTQIVRILLNPKPRITFTASPSTTVYAPNTVTITAQIDSTTQGEYLYRWNKSSSTTTEITVDESGTYTIYVDNANECGCSDSASIIITVLLKPIISVWMPDTTGMIGDINYTIPIYAKIITEENKIINLEYNADIRFDAEMYYPNKYNIANKTNEAIDYSNVNYYEKQLQLNCPDITITNEQTIIGQMTGIILVGVNKETPLHIQSFSFLGDSVEVETQDGKLTTNSCAKDIMSIRAFQPTELEILQSTNDTKARILSEEAGNFTLKIYDIRGVEIEKIKWNSKNKQDIEIKLQSEKYLQGIYNAILISPENVKSKAFVVVK